MKKATKRHYYLSFHYRQQIQTQHTNILKHITKHQHLQNTVTLYT